MYNHKHTQTHSLTGNYAPPECAPATGRPRCRQPRDHAAAIGVRSAVPRARRGAARIRSDGVGWRWDADGDGMGWNGMEWNGMGWDGDGDGMDGLV